MDVVSDAVSKTKEYMVAVDTWAKEIPAPPRLITVPHTNLSGAIASYAENIRVSARLIQYAVRAAGLFPLFDPECLSRMREADCVYLDRKLKLWLPVFSWADIAHAGQIIEEVFTRSHSKNFGTSRIIYSYDKLDKNEHTLVDPKSARYNALKISTTVPRVPTVIIDRVNLVRSMFDSVQIVFEADWTIALIEQKDPLIIGIIGQLSFLIDQFDLTKLERYISSEYCSGSEGKTA